MSKRKEVPSHQGNHEDATKVKHSLLNLSLLTKPSTRTKNVTAPSASKADSPQSTQRESTAPGGYTPGGGHPVPGKKGEKKRRIQAALPDALDHSKMKRLVEEGSILMARYQIDGMIAGGGFGQVYLATDKVTTAKYAVKVQSIQGGKELEKRIKLEMMLYTRLRGQNHIPLLVAGCPLPNQLGIALVMQLVGRSLADVRRQMPSKLLSPGTLYRAMRQVLSAISVIHEVGFLHRDVKPPNCCLGAIDVGRIYLLDFGLCRQYIDSTGMVRKPRKEAPFRGTLRYASLSGHAKQEFGPCNDLVAFLYSTVELGNAGLPWSRTAEKDKIERMKKDISNQQLCHNQPKLLTFTEEVMSMKYNTIPDYHLLMRLFDQFEPPGLTPETPYDWEIHPCDLEVKVKKADDQPLTNMTNNTLPEKA